MTSSLCTPFIVFTHSNRKGVRGWANWNSYSSMTCQQEWEFLAAISASFLASLPVASVHVSTPLSALRPGEAALAAEPRAGSRHGRCQALENMPGLLCSASFFWKWVCREELSPASDATHACQKCSTIHFLKFGTVTERLELTPECHLTLTSPVTVCWSKLQWCPSDKYKFWKLFSRPLNTFYLFGGDIQAHENMYVKEKENM